MYPLLLYLLPRVCSLDNVTLQGQGLQMERVALKGWPELSTPVILEPKR